MSRYLVEFRWGAWNVRRQGTDEIVGQFRSGERAEEHLSRRENHRSVSGRPERHPNKYASGCFERNGTPSGHSGLAEERTSCPGRGRKL